ncbi:hypothetical protein NQ315_014232 [Exocentrus adspersus]|uniref:Proteasome subunit alpha type 5 n=1 Tax=Exocentrus adspersus TaxID=1586481 RepID=A0AAV8VCG2_9CUCU|nr:hypothetical protein NQ315_014232 [Exocentrus adspersus]
MSVESCAQAVSNLAIQFGDSDDDGAAMSRPFGVAILFAGIDAKGPQLYHMDPSGTFVQFDAKAIGSGSEGAQQSLQEVYHRSMTLEEATISALTILKQVMEEKLNSSNVEVMTMTSKSLFHMFTKDQVEEVDKLEEIAPIKKKSHYDIYPFCSENFQTLQHLVSHKKTHLAKLKCSVV